MTSLARAPPVNQAIRVNILRLAIALAVPLLIFTHSAWPEPVFDVLEVAGIALIIAAVPIRSAGTPCVFSRPLACWDLA